MTRENIGMHAVHNWFQTKAQKSLDQHTHPISPVIQSIDLLPDEKIS